MEQAVLKVTLRRVWGDYLLLRDLRAETQRNYRQRLTMCFSDWLDLDIRDITKEMIEARHREIKGESMANSAMRTLRALLHFAAIKYEDENGEPILKRNPVNRLTELRAWHRDKRRTGVIRPRDMPAFFRAVQSLDNSAARDFFMLVLFTGLRKSEAQHLKWADVDLENGILYVTEDRAKNHIRHEVPLSEYVWDMLRLRSLGARSDYVFPGRKKEKPISDLQKAVNTIKARSGVNFAIHDLRRTFSTFADELDIKNELIMRLLNHKPKSITESYIVRSIERMREVTQQISDAILVHAGIKAGEE